MELHLDPLRPRRRREQDFATLDAVSLVPVMLTLLFHFLDYAYYKLTKSKGDPVARVVYITGCVFVFQADATMPYVFQTGAVLYAILGLSILAGIFQLPTMSLARTLRY
ncbi:hypothetical protein B0T18DRAFT_392867 [Schizothecium vesticola]|uniref:Uncharacterized protein n=1 Tax=Schizothecium vesticola TaxID=314040 RepID=A0AA40K371_9PEZI|nr:hypothetical protein B0T18DRAFT_392867 [Schizothecium vesticola]